MAPYHSKTNDIFNNLITFKMNLRSVSHIIHKLKYVLRTFNFKNDVKEEYIVANSLRGAFDF